MQAMWIRRIGLVVASSAGACALGAEGGSGPNMSGLAPETSTTADPTAAELDASPDADGTSSSTTPGACTNPSTYWDDADGDGFGDPDAPYVACVAPLGHVTNAEDCDDGDPATHPGASEPCGAGDRDCDGAVAPPCRSCAEILDVHPASADGVFVIDPDGSAGPLDPTPTWCDMTTDGGGWSLLQRTVWDPAQTDPLRSGFSVWRNTTLGSPQPGLAFRIAGAAWPELAFDMEHLLRIELRESVGGGSCAPLFYRGSGAAFTVTESTAIVGGLLSNVTFFSHEELTTTDSGPAGPCITGALALPWFHAVCCVTCPALRGDFWPDPHPMVNYADTPDIAGATQSSVCATGPLASMGFTGANLLEYYVR